MGHRPYINIPIDGRPARAVGGRKYWPIAPLLPMSRGDKNPEAVTEGSLVAVVDDQHEVAVAKLKLLEEAVIKEAVILNTAEFNSKVKLT